MCFLSTHIKDGIHLGILPVHVEGKYFYNVFIDMFFDGLLSSFHDIFVSHGVIFRKSITFILKHYVVQSVFIGILNWATILVDIIYSIYEQFIISWSCSVPRKWSTVKCSCIP